MSKTSNELRQAFLSFFGSRDHEVVPSGPLVPPNDPTLMFANAGMVQFKDVFTGREKRPYSRATSSQKCIRISGKHNDLEAVGPSPRHHTFFEMLGNFSFGDYFKEEAIVYAWDFLVKELQIPTERLVVTYFKGEGDVAGDEAARDLWRKVSGLSTDRIIGMGAADNFWQMGETGPCGPCSEIHYYNGAVPDVGAFGQEQTTEGVGWLEIWNLVFMQFERGMSTDGVASLANLPAPSIDTGAGLERLATLMQGAGSNYDSDLLRALVASAAEIARKPYGASGAPDDTSMRVIADHARTTAFLIAEGILPDNSEREYVLRRVMRRAIRHGHRLGIDKPFFHQVALKVVELMSGQFPELAERRELIESVTIQEEERFRRTIERGIGLLEDSFGALESAQAQVLPGEDAFKLHDTYGFPLDLTQVICAERGFAVDQAGYDAALQKARELSGGGTGPGRAIEQVYREALERVPGGATQFSGYERSDDSSTIVALIRNGELVDAAFPGESIEVVTAQTPFYGEAGGQVGDTGTIHCGDAVVEVSQTTRPMTGLFVHRGALTGGQLDSGASVELKIDVERRDAIRRNHSVTHLLHLGLRRLIGERAQQKGSVVSPERLRFDFTHDRPLSAEQIRLLEDFVNERILRNVPVQTEVLSQAEAKERGAMMIFEEKYGDIVRLLSIADSTELCGGTHARATGDIGIFKIVSEQGVAAGVRRITAITGTATLQYLREVEQTVARAALLTKTTPAQLIERVEKLMVQEKALEKQIEALQRKLLTGDGSSGLDAMLSPAREIGGIKVLGVVTEIADRAKLRELAEQLRDKLGESVVLVGSESDGKAQLVLVVSKALTNRLKAGELIGDAATVVGGSGGGRPDMAQAGGTQPAKLNEAIETLYTAVENRTR